MYREVLWRDPLGGHLFCFRGRSGNLLKVIWHDGQGACVGDFVAESGRRRGHDLTGAAGAILRKPGVRHRSADSFCLRITADVIPSSLKDAAERWVVAGDLACAGAAGPQDLRIG
jgi:hypothetical protein